MVKGMNTDDLRETYNIIVEVFKASRTMDSVAMKADLEVGMLVSWTGRKGYHKGTITKINRTKVVVREHNTSMVWTVPMSMLKIEG